MSRCFSIFGTLGAAGPPNGVPKGFNHILMYFSHHDQDIMDLILKIQKIEFGSMSVSYTDSVLNLLYILTWRLCATVNKNAKEGFHIIQ